MDIMRTYQPNITQRKQIVYIENINLNYMDVLRYYGRDIFPPDDVDDGDLPDDDNYVI